MKETYVPYHVHTMLSNGTTNIDSITDFHDYIDIAKQHDIRAIGFSEHGNIFEWVHKKEAVEAAGMKYLHCVEVYLTEDNQNRFRLSKIKTRDNYHVVLIAKNYDGVKELNKLVSKSFYRDDFHFYYVPRVSFDELFATSNNIIVTTACLGGVLNKGTPEVKERFLNFLKQNRSRCFLEIQHHNCEDQIVYNKMLHSISEEISVPLIAGTDTHALNELHMDGRSILQKSKNVHFENEDLWDLTFKSYSELVTAYKKQNSLPIDVVLRAINNTNVMADMVDEFSLDRNTKYPKLYKDSLSVFKSKINEAYTNHPYIKKRYSPDFINPIIRSEVDVYDKTGSVDFMLLKTYIKEWEKKNGIQCGYGRGSVSGSIVAYLLGITEMDSIRFGLNFFR